MSTIYIDPDRVDANADQIISLAKKLGEKLEEVNSKMKSLREDWQDEAQEEYDSSFSNLLVSFRSFNDSIPEYAKQAHNHADKMRARGKTL